MDFSSYPLSFMPKKALTNVCLFLDKEGPCDYHSLICIMQQYTNLFSNEEYEQFKNKGAITLLTNIASRDQTIGFLHKYLSMLPCDCCTRALSNAISKYQKAIINPENDRYGNYYFQPDRVGQQNLSNVPYNIANQYTGQNNHLSDQPNFQNNQQPSQNFTSMIGQNSMQAQADNLCANNGMNNELACESQGRDFRQFNNGDISLQFGQNSSSSSAEYQSTPSNITRHDSLITERMAYTDLKNLSIIDNLGNSSKRQLTRSISQSMGEMVITTQPKNCCLVEGELLTLTCDAKMKNNPDAAFLFQWSVNGQIVFRDSRNGKLMKEIGIQDRGIYRCHVTTDYQSNAVLSNQVYVSVVPKELDDSKFYATGKVALLIGNSNYYENPNLPAALNDVKILAGILQNDLDFKVLSFTDLTFDEIHKALNLFKQYIEAGCYCVFYFAGHGFQNADKCYLVPVDAGKDFPINDGIDVNKELQFIQRARSPTLMLILLDMCRKVNNEDKPKAFSSSYEDNVVICYSAKRNSSAFEVGNQGIFVNSLKKFLTQPIRVTHMLDETLDDIKKQSSLQRCEINNQLCENRSLCNHVIPGPNYFKLAEDYRLFCVHKCVVCEYTACEAYAKLIIQSVLSNVVEVLVVVVDPGKSKENCQVHIKTKDLEDKGLKLNILHHLDGYDKEYSTHIEITNVQILENLDIPVRLLYKFNDKENKKTQVFSVKLGIAEKWRTNFVKR